MLDTARNLDFNFSKSSADDHINDFDLMFADDTAIIVMSGNKETQGKILKSNSAITKLFGYNNYELQGHDVSILMPSIIAHKHQLFLENYFTSGKEIVTNNESVTFALHINTFIFPISIIVKPVPSTNDDIQYIGILRKIMKDYDYIITIRRGELIALLQGSLLR